MIRLFQLFALALFLAFLLTALGAALVGGATGSTPGCWDWPRWIAELQDQCQRKEALVERQDRVRSRLVCRRRVIADLIAARITLAEAVARFQELNANYPSAAWADRPDMSPEERLARDVIERVDAELLNHTPDQAAQVRYRLQVELEILLPAASR